MSAKRINSRDFYTCNSEELAQKLIGKIICHDIDGEVIRFRITETEAYCENDTASHSCKYKSGNGVVSQHMIGGVLYVHYDNKDYPGSSFDIVANMEGVAESVLIRGGYNLNNKNESYDSKPRLLGEALKIDYHLLNHTDLTESNIIWIEDDSFDTAERIIRQKRIGLDTATDITQVDKNRLLRFTLKSE